MLKIDKIIERGKFKFPLGKNKEIDMPKAYSMLQKGFDGTVEYDQELFNRLLIKKGFILVVVFQNGKGLISTRQGDIKDCHTLIDALWRKYLRGCTVYINNK